MTDRLAEIEARVNSHEVVLYARQFGKTQFGTACADRAYLLAEVKRLREALGECITDLNIAANNADHAAKTDPRWEGVGAVLRSRATSARTALEAKHD